MADSILDAETNAEERQETNAAAIAIALDGASDKPELARDIAAFLKEQRRLMAEQREQLRDQVKRMRLGIVDQRFSIALKAMTALIGVVVVAAFAFMVWNAYGSGGLIIDPLSVPPDLAARGLTGEVVASKLLDRLAAMQAQTDSQRDPQTFANFWGENIRVQIPETGVSLGELNRYLRETLGHPTRITGEIVHTAAGLSLTARAGTEGNGTVVGPETDVDALTQKLAESIYSFTQPYRYGAWLREHGRAAESLAVLIEVAKNGPASERPWAYLGWGLAVERNEGIYPRLRMMQDVLRRWPETFLAGQNIAQIEDTLSRPEQSIAEFRAIAPLLSSPSHGDVRPDVVPIAKQRVESFIDFNLGAFHDAAPLWQSQIAFGPQGVSYNMHAMLARAQLGEHDLAAARATMADPSEPGGMNENNGALDIVVERMQTAAEAEAWQGVIAEERATTTLFALYPGLRSLAPSYSVPILAFAHARLGDFKAAEALIATTPADCYRCMIVRAKIAELKREPARADWWFARAISRQPSIPFAYSDWGSALLRWGQYDAAIEKFKEAIKNGPHFADPLEMWGEALMQKNRSDLALAKFEEANKCAPNWGRLHLKWGEALFYAGKKDEAGKQFAIASTLELSSSDKAALASWVKAHG